MEKEEIGTRSPTEALRKKVGDRETENRTERKRPEKGAGLSEGRGGRGD